MITYGLRQKILLVTIFPILFVLTCIGVLTIYNKNTIENELFFSNFDSYRTLLEDGDLSFDTVKDKEKLGNLLSEQVLLAEIIRSDYSIIYTSENTEIASLTEEEKVRIAEAFLGTQTIVSATRNSQPTISIITPLIINGRVSAVLHQVMSNVELLNRVVQYAFSISLLLLLGLLVCYILIFILLSGTILKNIYKLKQGTIEVLKGNLDNIIDIKAKDELGDLAKNFNEMTAEVKKNRQLYEEYNKKLEDQVTERTKNLGIAEKKLKNINLDLESKVSERTAELEKLKSNLEETVVKRTADLSQKMEELERMNGFMVDREVRMVELKQKIKELEQK